MNLLSIKDLTKIGREAPLFTDVTLGLDEGQKAALIGKNGAGKSTLLNCVAGVLAPDKGSVVFNKEAGFSYVSLDLTGFRSGSMNEVIDTGKAAAAHTDGLPERRKNEQT